MRREGFVVRLKAGASQWRYLAAIGGYACVSFPRAHIFSNVEEARAEAERHASWREVMAVRWEVRVSEGRPRLYARLRKVKP